MERVEYEIVIEGRVEDRLVEALEGFHVVATGGTGTTVRGQVEDQEALHRLLRLISDLGLRLAGLHRIDPGGPAATAGGSHG